MSRTARRFSRTADSARGQTGAGFDVGFFTEPNYQGQAVWLNHGDMAELPPAGLNDQFQSVLVQNPSKVYAYTDGWYNAGVLFTTQSVADFSSRYFFGDIPWTNTISSYEIRPGDYSWPTVSSQPTYTTTSGQTIEAAPGSAAFSNCNIDSLTTDIQHQPSYDSFVAELSSASMKPAFEQACRNFCSVLYDSPDQVPLRASDVTFTFRDVDGTYAAGQEERTLYVYNNIGNDIRSAYMFAAAVFYTHGTATSTTEASGTQTGLWYYPSVLLGYRGSSNRGPVSGTANWYDGYTATAFFFDYIQNHAPTPSPRFVRDLNASFDARNPAIGNTPWNKSAITGINARGMTVEQLWTEYTQWLVDIAGDVTFFSGSNYSGEAVAYTHGAAANTIVPTFHNKLRSVRVNTPSKVYLFTEENQSGAVLFTTTSVPYMFQRYFWQTWRWWYDDVESFRVRDASWAWPQITNQSEVFFNDGSSTIVNSSSQLYDVVTTRDDPQIIVDDTTTYNDVKAIMPDNTVRAHFDQAGRNACAILYDNPDEIDVRHYRIDSKYVYRENAGAYADKHASVVGFTQASKNYDGQFGLLIAHELVHMYQIVPQSYGSDVYVTGVIEGIADYAVVMMNYVGTWARPSGGGVYWYDGYFTTAFFFHYITHSASVISPNFVKDLNRQMDPRTHGTREWTPDLITQINVQGKTVDQLWSEYKAWLA